MDSEGWLRGRRKKVETLMLQTNGRQGEGWRGAEPQRIKKKQERQKKKSGRKKSDCDVCTDRRGGTTRILHKDKMDLRVKSDI